MVGGTVVGGAVVVGGTVVGGAVVVGGTVVGGAVVVGGTVVGGCVMGGRVFMTGIGVLPPRPPEKVIMTASSREIPLIRVFMEKPSVV